MLKITQVITDTNIGGAGILLSSIVRGLSDDFLFEVILPKGSRLKERLPSNVKITELDITGDVSFSPKDAFKFYKHFSKQKPDIVHTHASLSARIGAKTAGVSTLISTRHCAKVQETVKKMNIPKRLIYNGTTDLTVSTADFATENLIKYGVDENRIRTIKNGSPDLKDKIYGSDFSLYSALGIDKSTKIVGSVARLERIKGQDLILRSAKDIINEYENVHFLFLGTGSLMEEYRKMASALGISDHVTFLGYVERPELYQKDFYINLNASRGTETSCLATSECMSLGIPTVASDFGGNTEMIKDGINGLVFNTDNTFSLSEAVLRILRDGELYKKLSVGAKRSYHEEFSLSKMLDSYRNLYLSFDNKRTKARLRGSHKKPFLNRS